MSERIDKPTSTKVILLKDNTTCVLRGMVHYTSKKTSFYKKVEKTTTSAVTAAKTKTKTRTKTRNQATTNRTPRILKMETIQNANVAVQTV